MHSLIASRIAQEVATSSEHRLQDRVLRSPLCMMLCGLCSTFVKRCRFHRRHVPIRGADTGTAERTLRGRQCWVPESWESGTGCKPQVGPFSVSRSRSPVLVAGAPTDAQGGIGILQHTVSTCRR